MAVLSIEINCEVEIPDIFGTYDNKKRKVPEGDLQKFVSGELGEHYLEILIPNDGIFTSIQAQKKLMKKKGAIFSLELANGGVNLKVQGVFKVNLYSHVLERIKNEPTKIYVSGLFSGDYPPFGGRFRGFDEEAGSFPVLGNIV
jgi:hypothetical protein